MRIPRPALTPLLLAVVAGLGVTTTQPASAELTDCGALTTGLHQLVSPDTAANLLTTSSAEAESAARTYGFSAAGVVARVSNSAADGLVSVNRMQKGGDFIWAATADQRATAEQAGYKIGSAPFYALGTTADGCSAVYQLQHMGVHRIAVGEANRDKLIQAGWSGSELVFYAASTGVDLAVDAARPVPSAATAGPISDAGTDSKFTLAIMPDTQNEVGSASDPRLPQRARWIVANKSKYDIRFMLHSGDVVNWDTPDHGMFANAASALMPVQATIPMAIAVGNHDTAAVCPGGSACPGANTSVTVRNTSTYNAYFPRSRFGAVAGQFEPGKMDNAYHKFTAGRRNWLVLNLELWPRKEVVAWAKRVVVANPKRNVIIVTHSYLTRDGKISTSNGGYGATSPRYLYDQVVQPYPNVKLIFSGHVGTGAIRGDRGAKNTKIVSMLQAFHSRSNPVRMVTIDTANGTLKTWVYVPSEGRTWTSYGRNIERMSFVR